MRNEETDSFDPVQDGTDLVNSILANAQSMQRFHTRCGRRITFSNDHRTATRSMRDFSHALVFSSEPLINDILFEVVIEKKNLSWGGSIEIGVVSEPPDDIELPSCATVLRNGTWIMSGIDVRRDGLLITELYGTNLELLNENDRVGVMRTSSDELVFYVNGVSQGPAAYDMPKTLWAVIDLYGRCIQASIYPVISSSDDEISDSNISYEQNQLQQSNQNNINNCNNNYRSRCINSDNVPRSLESLMNNMINNSYSNSILTGNISVINSSTAIIPTSTNLSLNTTLSTTTACISRLSSMTDYHDMNDHIRFHTRCGSLVRLSPNCRSAERRRPFDEFNNGVVMTHRPLRDNEVFEIRIDKLVDKWSGSIEVGVTTHSPSSLHFPATMTNMRSGTIMMSGCGILTNGKGTRRQYGEFNLDELREGDRVGMVRKANGNLHYYINGRDQGIAALRVPQILWGVIDLYGMTIKVTIVDRNEREQQNLVTRRNNLLLSGAIATPSCTLLDNSDNYPSTSTAFNTITPDYDLAPVESSAQINMNSGVDRLTFHPICGAHAMVIESGRTALRPNAPDDFNNGVVLTRRPLRPNELFQVRLERVVAKWAGSVEIGVTIYGAEDLDFPFTMTNVRSGTWMMTGNGVMQNGITVIEQYGVNLDRLQVGDRVGVVRKDNGTLHFWVNGVDQGPAAINVPENVYGVIDLYGQAAQASIVDTSECDTPDTGNSTISNTTLYSESPLKFHNIHGRNATVFNNNLSASRTNSLTEFNDAIVFSNRPLRQRELFEVVIDLIVRHWSGNIEIGVIGTRPEDLQMCSSKSDFVTNYSVILCGPLIFHNQKKMRSNILTNLDKLNTGTRVGVMRNGNFIHFFINGVDQGPACACNTPSLWAIVDLYGQCVQVSLTQNSSPELRAPYAISENSQSYQANSVMQPFTFNIRHCWTAISGNDLSLSLNGTIVSRFYNYNTAVSSGIAFSQYPLTPNCPFEFKILTHNLLLAGCLRVGVTDLNILDSNVRKYIPLGIDSIPANVWYVSGSEMYHNDEFFDRAETSLEWLRTGDRITLELNSTRTLKITINSNDAFATFYDLPKEVYAVVELRGATLALQVTSSPSPSSPLRPFSLRLQDSLELGGADPLYKQDSMLESIDSEIPLFEFSEFCGKNICLLEDNRSAMRLNSYNNGMVYVTKPLCKGESICIKIDSVNTKWQGTLGIGVVDVCPNASNPNDVIPTSILQCKRSCWVATHDYVNINGRKITSSFGEVLEYIKPGTVISMILTFDGILMVMVGSHNLEELAEGLPNQVYPVFDLYGKCERITIITAQEAGRNGTPVPQVISMFEQMILNNTGPSTSTSVPECEKADLETHEKWMTKERPSTSNSRVTTTTIGGTTINLTSLSQSISEVFADSFVANSYLQSSKLEQHLLKMSELSKLCGLPESVIQEYYENLIRSVQRSKIISTGNDSLTESSDDDDDNKPPTYRRIYSNTNIPEQDESLCNISENVEDNNLDSSNNQIMEVEVSNTEAPKIDSDYLEISNYLNNILANILTNESEISSYSSSTLEMQPYMISSTQYSSGELIASSRTSDCAHLKIVTLFKNSLRLPINALKADSEAICLCRNCTPNCPDFLCNWVYFKVNCASNNNLQSMSMDWLLMYYKTSMNNLRTSLDVGHLLPNSNWDIDAITSSIPFCMDISETTVELNLSPNDVESSFKKCDHYYISSKFYNVQAALEVYVKREALCAYMKVSNVSNILQNASDDEDDSTCVAENITMPTNSNSNATTDSSSQSRNRSNYGKTFTSHLPAWFTKDIDACTITALLLKLEIPPRK